MRPIKYTLVATLLLGGCIGVPSIPELKATGETRSETLALALALAPAEAFDCLRTQVLDGQWSNSTDQRRFVVGNINKPGNVNAVLELTPSADGRTLLNVWYVSWIDGIWTEYDKAIASKCHGGSV
jgi:hypothetical protein